MKNNEDSIRVLYFLEYLIDEIEEYLEYIENDEINIDNKIVETLGNTSDMLYKETRQMRRSIGLPHLV